MQPSSDPESEQVLHAWTLYKTVLLSLMGRIETKLQTRLALCPGFVRYQLCEKLKEHEELIRTGILSQFQSDFPEECDELNKIMNNFLEAYRRDYQDGFNPNQTQTNPEKKDVHTNEPINFAAIESQTHLTGFGPVGGIGWWGQFF